MPDRRAKPTPYTEIVLIIAIGLAILIAAREAGWL
jgi:hypothetical protein